MGANTISYTVSVLLNLGGSPLLPPTDLIARVGPGTITLHWTPSPSPGVAGYRIGYGPTHEHERYSGDQAAEGPSVIEVGADQSVFTLTCMPDSVKVAWRRASPTF